jgi:hypothetical protein
MRERRRKIMNKILMGIFMAVFCLVWTGCNQATGSGDTQDEYWKSQRIKKSREHYNKHLLGRWHRGDGSVSEFKENSFTIYEGDSLNIIKVDNIDFETLFEVYGLIDTINGVDVPRVYFGDDEAYLMIYPDPANKKVFINFRIDFRSRSYSSYDADFHVAVKGYADGRVEKTSDMISNMSARYRKEGSENYNEWKAHQEEQGNAVIDIKGSYTLTDNGLDHALIFNNNGTYNFEHASNSSGDKSGSWSANGNDITMGYDLGGTTYTEVLTASKSGSTVTLQVKDSSTAISAVRNSFGLLPDKKMILVQK